MATGRITGDVVQGVWQCYGDWTTTETGTTVTISVTCGFRSIAWGISISGFTATSAVNGLSTSTTNTSFYSANGATVEKDLITKSVTIAKTQSAQSIAIGAEVINATGYRNGTSTAGGTITVPALASHTVSYDANGGSGAPSSQTKWYGTILTLSSTVPTRTGYAFDGWATSATGSVAYSAGGQYGADADVTLYAVWTLLYVAPGFSAATAYRVASSSSTAEDAAGGYVRASFSWLVDTTVTSGNEADAVVVQYRAGDATTWTTATVSGTTTGTSGTVTTSFEAAVEDSWVVRCSVTDTSGQASSTTTMSRVVGVGLVPIDVGSKGAAVGLLSAAPDKGLRIGDDAAMAEGTSLVAETADGTVSATWEDVANAANGGYVSYGGTSGLRLFVGSAVKRGLGNTSLPMWTDSEFKSAFGVSSSSSEDGIFVAFANGDGGAQSLHIDCATYQDGTWYATFPGTVASGSAVRINYLVVVPEAIWS